METNQQTFLNQTIAEKVVHNTLWVSFIFNNKSTFTDFIILLIGEG